jgi:hypothetical protein
VQVTVELVGGPGHGCHLALDAKDAGGLISVAVIDGEPVAMTPKVVQDDAVMTAAAGKWTPYFAWPLHDDSPIRYGTEPWPPRPVGAGASN